MGYILLPEEEPTSLNDSFLGYSLTMNNMQETGKPSIASPLFLVDSSIVEIVTADIAIDCMLSSIGEEAGGKQPGEDALTGDEIEYEVVVDFKNIEKEYDMVGVDREQNNVSSIEEAGQYAYRVTAGEEATYIAKCAAIDENTYIVLSDAGIVYSIGKSCTVRKQGDKRLEE